MKQSTTPSGLGARLKNLTTGHVVVAIFVGLAIFVLGVNVGNGRIVLGGQSTYTSQNNLPADLNYESVERVYDVLREKYDGELTVDQLMDGLKQGLARATDDPHTEYLNAEESAQFYDDLEGTFSGIGAELSRRDSSIVIVAPIAGFPAEEAGLLPQDVVTEIDGKSAYDITLTEAVSRIRGEAGTEVNLKIIRNETQELDFTITRQQITLPSVEHEMLDGNLGYIKISRFSDDTARLTREAAQSFVRSGAKGIIVDVRSNPGGLLESSVEVAELWLPAGTTILEERRGEETIREFKATSQALLEGVPTVVLINEGSASASEIVAGALKDNQAATLVGQQSFGKGSVQSLERLLDGATLKVTVARWFTPGGKNIDQSGISPDKEVEQTLEDFQNDLDPQKDAAIDLLSR